MFRVNFFITTIMETLIVIANLGRVRPVHFRRAGDDPQQKPHLFERPGCLVEMRPEQIREVVTDQAGRFPQSPALDRLGGMSYGEEHNLKSELEKQALERIADKIAEIVTAAGNPAWRLVFPQKDLPSLIRALPTPVRQSLAETVHGDLTSIPLPELEKRFLNGN